MTDSSNYDGWCGTRTECYKELGYALFYMAYLNDGEPWPSDQKERVAALCQEASTNEKTPGQGYWRDLLTRINDEIENMC